MTLIATAPAMAQQETGNGAISGGHFNLNLRGSDHCPGDDMKGSNTHVIHVALHFSDVDPDPILGDGNYTLDGIDKTNKIFLSEGDFRVADGNACDGDGARLYLPANPCDDGDLTDGICDDNDPVFTEYLVFVRELGKPGGTGDIRTCAYTDTTVEDEVVCSTENVLLARDYGRPKFTNETKKLTTLVVDTNPDPDVTTLQRVEIFSDLFEGYYWDYDNNGLVLVQLRFYPISG
jgi:hypothetical protein